MLRRILSRIGAPIQKPSSTSALWLWCCSFYKRMKVLIFSFVVVLFLG
jgi:hypothetical protein